MCLHEVNRVGFLPFLSIMLLILPINMHAVSLHRVVEVREGQNTEMFDKFPYELVEKQSFSLIYQQEGIHIN